MLAFDGKHQTFTKAQQTGAVVNKMVADGKRAKRQRREEDYQMNWTDLPRDTYTPFDE